MDSSYYIRFYLYLILKSKARNHDSNIDKTILKLLQIVIPFVNEG